MTMLQNTLSEKIPNWQESLKNILSEKGKKVISEVTVEQAVKGMRGVKSLICDTSSVSAEKGLIIRDHPILDITHILPEEVLHLLLTGDLPSDDQLADLQNQLKLHQDPPDYIWKVLEAMPADSHPMTMLSVAIQSMRVDSLFVEKFNKGTVKSDYWKWILDDGIKLIGVLPSIAAGIYRMRTDKNNRISNDPDLDWAGNFAHMLGVNESDDFKKLMRLYLMLHSDHEGGNVSAFSSLTVASSLSSSAIGRPSGNALSIMPLIRAAITKLCSTDSNSSNNTDGSVTLSMKVRSINMASADETMSGSKSVLLPSASAIAPVEEKLIVSRRLVIMSP